MLRVLFGVFTLVTVAMLVAACGSSGDDDDDDGGGDNGAEATATADGEGDGGDDGEPTSEPAGSGGGDGVDAGDVDEGTFPSGSVHLEISGDKDEEIDIEGTDVGFSQAGLVFLAWADAEVAVTLSLVPEEADEPGAIAVTTADFATAGAWGDGCEISIDDGEDEVRGEFSCDNIEAIDIRQAKSYEIDIRGSFTAKR